MPQRVKRQEVILPDLELVPQIVQPRLQNPTLRVNIRNAKHQHRSPQMMVKINALGHATPRHRQQNRPAATLARLHVVHQRVRRLGVVLRLDEQQLVPQQGVDDALVVPRRHHRFQVEIGREEAHDPVRDGFGRFHQQLAVVARDGGVLARLELGRDGHLVVAAGDDLREEIQLDMVTNQNQIKKLFLDFCTKN